MKRGREPDRALALATRSTGSYHGKRLPPTAWVQRDPELAAGAAGGQTRRNQGSTPGVQDAPMQRRFGPFGRRAFAGRLASLVRCDRNVAKSCPSRRRSHDSVCGSGSSGRVGSDDRCWAKARFNVGADARLRRRAQFSSPAIACPVAGVSIYAALWSSCPGQTGGWARVRHTSGSRFLTRGTGRGRTVTSVEPDFRFDTGCACVRLAVTRARSVRAAACLRGGRARRSL